MTKARALTAAIAVLGAGLVVTGIYLRFGLDWALIAAGAAVTTLALAVDVD